MAKTRKRPAVFLHWLVLRAGVNSAELAGLDEALGQRIEQWTARSYELEDAWRGK